MPSPKIWPRAVLFDWDNTLVDAWPVMHDCMNAALAAMGHEPWTLQQAQARMARSLREYFPDLFGADWHKARDVYYRHFDAIHQERIQPFPDSEALLKLLHGAGCHLAVISNKSGPYLRKEVAVFGWSHYFTQIVGAGDAARDKPAPDHAIMALRGAAETAQRNVWFVGDSGVDMLCARAIDALPVLLRADPPEDAEHETWGDVFHLPDRAALMNHLLRNTISMVDDSLPKPS